MKQHDITHLIRATCKGEGFYLKHFQKGLENEIEKVKNKGFKGPLRIKHVDGGMFGMNLYITGK